MDLRKTSTEIAAEAGCSPCTVRNRLREIGVPLRNRGMMVGGKHSEETKRKIGDAHRGRIWGEGFRRKISESRMGRFTGPDNSNWRGGKSFEPYPIEFNAVLKRSIRERDNHTCQLCRAPGRCVHHLDYDKSNCDSMNLITLCRRCHSKVNGNRDYWSYHFGIYQEIRSEIRKVQLEVANV